MAATSDLESPTLQPLLSPLLSSQVPTAAMAASMASPIATSLHTITEHDYRFPRRPMDHAPLHHDEHSAHFTDDSFQQELMNLTTVGASAAPDHDLSAKAPGSSSGRLRLDMEFMGGSAQRRLSRDDVFADLRRGTTTYGPEQDSLATEIWRFFSKTKQQLPNQERMANLGWRMMHVKLQSAHSDRYAMAFLRMPFFPLPFAAF